MKALITGTRLAQSEFLFNRVRAIVLEYEPQAIAHGKSPAGGVDFFAERICNTEGIEEFPYPVNHGLDGSWPAAGPRRSNRMLEVFCPDIVLAFPAIGHPSKGTRRCIEFAIDRGVQTHIYPLEIQ